MINCINIFFKKVFSIIKVLLDVKKNFSGSSLKKRMSKCI